MFLKKGLVFPFIQKHGNHINFSFNSQFEMLYLWLKGQDCHQFNVNPQLPERPTQAYQPESLSLANISLITNYLAQRNFYGIKAVVTIKLAIYT